MLAKETRGTAYWKRKSDACIRSGADSYTYRKYMLSLLGDVVEFDAFCCTLVDPGTLCSIGAVTEYAIEAIHHELLKNEYGEADVNKFTDLLKDDISVARLSDTLGEKTSRRYEEVLKPHCFSDETRCVLVSQAHCYGYLTLFRKEQYDSAYFSDEEMGTISIIVPVLAEALKAYYLSVIEVEHFEGAQEQGVMVLDNQLNMISFNTKALDMLDCMRGLEGVTAPFLPKPLQVMCTKLLVGQSSPEPLHIPIPDRGYIVLQVSALQSVEGKCPYIAISIGSATAKDMLAYLMQAYHLTPREQETVREIIKGQSTKEIAEHLEISYYTAQDHLKSIFQKVQVTNRNELVWKLLSKHQME